MTLESLEHRTLLSNVTVVYNPTTLDLKITGDVHSDRFTVLEYAQSAGGNVDVIPSLGVPPTLINGAFATFHTSGAVKTIEIVLPGLANSPNFDVVNILEKVPPSLAPGSLPPPTTVTNVTITDNAVGLILNVGDNGSETEVGVNNLGALTLIDGGVGGGFLDAEITNSHFATLSIDAHLAHAGGLFTEVEHSVIDGAVTISQGNGNFDAIDLNQQNKFGSTKLSQGNGFNDRVYAAGTDGDLSELGPGVMTVKDLTVTQGNGNQDLIYVDHVYVSLGSFGVRTTQGNGGSDVTVIDFVRINPATMPRNITTIPAVATSISVTQGNGDGDYANVAETIVPGNITILQGTGAFDYAQVIFSHAGIVLALPPFALDFFGNVRITQRGPFAAAVLDHDDVAAFGSAPGFGVNNVVINQPAGGSIAQINDTGVTSDITITQGAGTAVDGFNVVAIGYAYFTFDPGFDVNFPGLLGPSDPASFSEGFASSPVIAGGATTITQAGEANVVFLGDVDSSFTTLTLDINTGAGGGGTVLAYNTTATNGSVGTFNIDGGGNGNTYIDVGGNNLTFNPFTYNYVAV